MLHYFQIKNFEMILYVAAVLEFCNLFLNFNLQIPAIALPSVTLDYPGLDSEIEFVLIIFVKFNASLTIN